MIDENDDKNETDSEVAAGESEDTGANKVVSEDVMPDIGGDTVVDVAGVLEAIVEKFDKEDTDEAAEKRAVRKRLDEIAEQRDKELDSTFNINLDEDL